MNDRIVKTIDLKAPVSRVWQALTNYDEFGNWFRAKIDVPFAVGEVSTGHITYPGYEHYKWYAVVQKMEHERCFSFTWPHPADVNAADYSKDPMTLVEFTLEPIEGGTRLTITESGFENIPEDRRGTAFRDNDGGWTQQMKNIEAHIAHG
ncbi:MAG: SRPBCC family protein [Candidatus Hydrogenedentes bacterium]|nr:SRPBCC family protein [Candidatus Hydrogenedentota bacterium]